MDTRPEPKSVKLDISKPKPRRLRVGDPDFIPPDGGWGWLILFACGFSNVQSQTTPKRHNILYFLVKYFSHVPAVWTYVPP